MLFIMATTATGKTEEASLRPGGGKDPKVPLEARLINSMLLLHQRRR